jgi:integrase
MVIGDATKLTLAQARKKAKTELAKVELGQDPQGEKKAERKIGTFKAIAEEFIEHQSPKRRAATIDYHKRYLLNHCRALHGLKPDEIRRPEIASVLKSISKAYGPHAADGARSHLSSMFSWAIAEGLCGETYTNPVIGTNKQAPEPKSDDVTPGRDLADVEIAEIWLKGDGDFGRIVKLLFLTGSRRTEMASLAWDEVSDDTISLSGSRTKNHLRHDIPLSDMAREVIGERPEDRRFVFGKIDTGYSGFSKSKAELDAKLKGVAPWRLHDIRHTVSTRMHELGVEPHIIEACLNHISGARAGIAGRYNHARYSEQKAAALTLWANELSVILAKARGDNVERLHKRPRGRG